MRPLAKKKKFLNWPVVLASLIILIIVGVGVVRTVYINELKPVSSVTATQYFTVENGESADQIASGLKEAGLIRSTTAFKNYVRTNELNSRLQHGTYTLSPSMSTQQIVTKMVNGQVTTNLVTILPGKRLDQIKAAFARYGYFTAEIDAAFDPASYSGNPLLANLPAGASLEGFLYPDSFQKDADTPASQIVLESLSEMSKKLTPDIIDGFTAHGLNVYQGVTLASIVYQESGDPAYEPTIAQVFLSRLAQNIPLQSNVTADYAADISGQARSTNIDSLYNTYKHAGLPPGPISNLTVAALKAVAQPSKTNYLYFVADENSHKVYFSTNSGDHEAQIRQYCPNTCEQQ